MHATLFMSSPWTHKMDSTHAHWTSSFPSLFVIRLLSHRGQLLLSSCLSFSILIKHNTNLRVIDVEEQLSRLKTLQLQGRWLEWSGLMNLDLSWQQLIHNWSDKELRFALQATTNTVPTPLNLRRWGHQSVDPSCQLCGRPASLRHILNACPSALNQGRYTWRHDSVLRILKRHLLSFWQSPLTQSTIKDRANLSTQPYIRFVPAGSAS